MSISTPPARIAPEAADEVDALRSQIESLQRSLAHATALLRTTQETCMVWEQTFNAVSDPVAVIASDYRVLRANAAYRRLLDEAPALSEWHFCFDGAAEPCEGCPLTETMLSRRPGHVRTERVVSSDALAGEQTHTFERWIYPIVNADGTVDRVVEIIKDVTEEVRLREATSAAEALRQADRLKAELLGTVSHELRSPLAAIQGYAGTLLRHEKRLPTAERHEFLTAIQEAGTRLSTIVDRMLELSELDTGSYPLRQTPVDLARTVREALAGARRSPEADEDAGGATSTFVLRLEDVHGMPVERLPLVQGDARLLRDLLDHLIENAVKYSPAGDTVTVTLRPREMSPLPRANGSGAIAEHAASSEGPGFTAAGDDNPASIEVLEVTIQDHGMGIPAEHLPRVFERFHQVDSGLTRAAGGMGLGLAICQRITELHHGVIWAESTPGDGSTFHVLLPLAQTTVE